MLKKRKFSDDAELMEKLHKIAEKEGIAQMQDNAMIRRIKEYRLENELLSDEVERLKAERALGQVAGSQGAVEENLNNDDEKNMEEIERTYLSKLKNQIKRQETLILELKRDVERRNMQDLGTKKEVVKENRSPEELEPLLLKILEEVKAEGKENLLKLEEENKNFKIQLEAATIKESDVNKELELERQRKKTLDDLIEKIGAENIENFKRFMQEKEIYTIEMEDMDKKIIMLENKIGILKTEVSEGKNIAEKEREFHKKQLEQVDEKIRVFKIEKETEASQRIYFEQKCGQKMTVDSEEFQFLEERGRILAKMADLNKLYQTRLEFFEQSRKELKELEESKNALDLERLKIKKRMAESVVERNEQKEMNIKTKAEIEGLKTKIHDRSHAASYHKRNFLKVSSDLSFFKRSYEALDAEKRGLFEKYLALLKKSEESEKKLSHFMDEKKALDKISSLLTKDDNHAQLLEDVEKYRRLLRCTACDLNYKDTVLLKCMHILCKSCVDSRLKYRNRKCPSCGEGFAANDAKRVFL